MVEEAKGGPADGHCMAGDCLSTVAGAEGGNMDGLCLFCGAQAANMLPVQMVRSEAGSMSSCQSMPHKALWGV